MAATKLSLYQMSIRFLADARLALISEDVETRYALDDAWDSAVAFVLRQAAWRFALKTAVLGTTTGPLAGFANAYSKPADWLRTHALFVLSGATECPIDIREQGLKFSANLATGILIRHVSSDYADPALAANPWPEHFAQCVGAYLAFLVANRVTGDESAAGRMSHLFASLLPEAVAHDALPENPWLGYQLDGSFAHGSRFVLGQGFWHFALITATPAAGGTPATGYANSFVQPADLLRTHALYLATGGRESPFDARDQDTHWSTNVAAIKVRYVSTAGLDATLWPEGFNKAVLAFLDAQNAEGPAREKAVALYGALLGEALQAYADEPNPWLPHQLNGEFLRVAREYLANSFWRFQMKTAAISAVSGTPATGYSKSFAMPDDWLRTHALYRVAQSRENPFDVREQAGFWSTNAASFTARYLSSTLDSTIWLPLFEQAVLARLEFDEGEPGEAGRKQPAAWQAALLAAQVALALVPDPWLDAQLDGSFQRIARSLSNEGFWRFSRVTALVNTTSGSAQGGFGRSCAVPADWGRTRALWVLTTDGRRMPFDVRQAAGFWHTDATAFYVDYVSTTAALDAALWPDHYLRAVLRQVEFDRANRGDAPDQQQDAAAWKDALAAVLASESDGPDPWLGYQLDGSFARAAKAVMAHGFWDWALKEAPYDTGSQSAAAADQGFPYRYDMPADWFRTHALFVPFDGSECPINIRETASSGWSTDSGNFVARYVSTDALNATTWPEIVGMAVLAYLQWRTDPDAGGQGATGKAQSKGAVFERLLGEALAVHSQPPSEWLRFQLDGRYRQAVQMLLEKGRWRFAVKSVSLTESTDPDPAEEADGTASNTYAYRFVKPDDWLKTLWVYFVWASGLYACREDLDFREEEGAIHANRTPVTLRYVSRLGLDATRWTSHFRDACQAWLEHIEARADPKMAGVAQAKLQMFKDACDEAERFDDGRDMPPLRNVGRLVAARRGRSSYDMQQGWPPWR